MTEETRGARMGSSPGRSAARNIEPGPYQAGPREVETTRSVGAERDMREILASIRKLMRETPAPEPGVTPDARRREERARRFETVAPPPRAALDDWPDDPEIDVDALAEELLRMAGSLAARRAAAHAKTQAPTAPPPPPTGAPREAWGELDALLSYAEEAFEAGGLEVGEVEDRGAVEPSTKTLSSGRDGLASDSDLVAYPTPDHLDPGEPMPDLSAVLSSASDVTAARDASALSPPSSPSEPASSTAPTAAVEPPQPDASSAPPATATDERTTVPAPPPSADRVPAPPPSAPDRRALSSLTPAPEADRVDRGEPAIPESSALESPSDPSASEQAQGAPSASQPAAPVEPPRAQWDTVPAPPPTQNEAAAPEPAPEKALSSSPQAGPAPAAASMPDDPRNRPSEKSRKALDTIGAMVRAKAKENLEKGLTTYSGRDPHPRIVEKTGWTRGPDPDRGDGPGDDGGDPPVTPTDLALKALDQGDSAAPAEAASRAASTPPQSAPAEAEQALRPVLADWLDHNLARLMEDLVKERMQRLSQEGETDRD